MKDGMDLLSIAKLSVIYRGPPAAWTKGLVLEKIVHQPRSFGSKSLFLDLSDTAIPFQ